MSNAEAGTPGQPGPTDVLATLGHELRGPLGVARGYLRLLAQAGDLSEKQAGAVGQAARAADRMAALLDEISEYTRWLRGERALAPERIALAPLAATAIAAIAPAPELRIPPDLMVDADPVRLGSALTTLADAATRILQDLSPVAIVATPATGTGALTITVGPAHPPAATDGEAPADLRRSGHGLGLALADCIIRAHGGSLTERHGPQQWGGYVIRL